MPENRIASTASVGAGQAPEAPTTAPASLPCNIPVPPEELLADIYEIVVLGAPINLRRELKRLCLVYKYGEDAVNRFNKLTIAEAKEHTRAKIRGLAQVKTIVEEELQDHYFSNDPRIYEELVFLGTGR